VDTYHTVGGADNISQHFGIYHSVNVLQTLMCDAVGSDFLSIRDSQCTYKRNSEARLCNHCCSGKVISITHVACAFVALGIQHSKHVRHIVIYGLPSVFFLFNRHCNSYGLWPDQLSLSILSRKVFTECRCQRHVKPPTWRTSD